MLAKRYKDQKKNVTYPCLLQPKLNGIRALYAMGRFQSRDQHLWNEGILDHLEYILRDLSDRYVLDGEMYVHGMSLQKINGAVSVNRVEQSPLTSTIEYHVYDYIDRDEPHMEARQRMDQLPYVLAHIPRHGFVVPVKTITAYSEADAEKWYGTWMKQRYEGMMYRQIDVPYGFEVECGNKENRWVRLLKRKDWLDDWFVVDGMETGTGKFTEVIGSLTMTMPNGKTFSAGSGMSDGERKMFLTNPPEKVHIKYEMLSDEGVPLKPTIIECK